MFALIPFPNIDPVIFSVELFGFTLALRWYALAYVAGFLLAWWWINRALRVQQLWPENTPPATLTHTEDFLTWAIIGTIVGGRLGYVFFYVPDEFLTEPQMIWRVWEGGMSFHGGFLGVVTAGLIFCHRHKIPALSFGDALAMGVPFGLLLGRLANFINAELWGRPTLQDWGVVFPDAPPCPDWWTDTVCARHPSQLYEAALEGMLMFIVITWLAYRRGALKTPGQLIAVFFIGYGGARVLVEFVRQGDDQFVQPNNPWGHVLRIGQDIESTGLTMGQILSTPMIVFGIVLLFWVRRRK